jgi:predicted MFS family arabinose efflux permease
MTSTGLFFQIKEPDAPAANPKEQTYTLRSVFQTISDDIHFRDYALFGVIWNLAVGLGNPYFAIYMVQGLQASPTQVGLLSIVAGLSGLPALRLFGTLTDSWGARKVQLLTGFLLPLLPPLWILARLPLHGILINIPGGILWAGFNLASLNYLLGLAPSEKRARYAALFQLAVALSSAAGAYLGSIIISHWGYYPVFALCGIGRLAGILYYARFVQPMVSPDIS